MKPKCEKYYGKINFNWGIFDGDAEVMEMIHVREK